MQQVVWATDGIHRRPPAPRAADGEHTGGLRSGRVASAVLRQEAGSGVSLMHIHETYLAQAAARA